MNFVANAYDSHSVSPLINVCLCGANLCLEACGIKLCGAHFCPANFCLVN